MKRFVSIWFPNWPMQRLARAEPGAVPLDRPMALVQASVHGVRLAAVNARARREGLAAGLALADARAMVPGLVTRDWDEAADEAALYKLARWCGRYGPQRHVCGSDGLWIDTSGVAHLFGGEEGLMRDIMRRLEAFGLRPRAALAETHGAAYALARDCWSDQSSGTLASNFRLRCQDRLPAERTQAFVIVADGAVKRALCRVSVETLRLETETVRLLRRLGLKRIGQLYDLPREGLARRFREDARASGRGRGRSPGPAQAALAAQDVLRRLDQALGRSPEPLEGLLEPPVLSVSKAWTDPLMTAVGIEAEARVLAERLVEELDRSGLGARRVRLGLYRSDGTMAEQTVGTSSPSLDAGHIFGLLRERLDRVDVGFGVDALVMEAVLADPVDAEQQAFGGAVNDAVCAGQWRNELARLADRLGNRLGREAVGRLVPVQSHIPERAQRWEPVEDVGVFAPSSVSRQHQMQCAANVERAGNIAAARAVVASDASRCPADDARWPMPAHVQLPRPCFVLPSPEPIMVLAQVPEGAPRRFTWRRVVHDVAEAHGPERITPEWWREIAARIRRDGEPPGEGGGRSGGGRVPSRPRDYYRVQVRCGASFWIYREGLFSGGFCGEDVPDQAGEDFSSRPRWFLQGIYG